MKLITVGEMVIDFLPGLENGSYIMNAGGAPANVAIAVARNGLDSGIFCKLGNDDFGKFLYKTLEDNKVTPLVSELTDTAITTMVFVSLDENNERSFTFARKPGADMLLSVEDIKLSYLRNCTILHAGSCSLSEGTAVDATKFAMTSAHEMEKLVSFDINYRNLMWNDNKELCTAKVLEILPYVDLLKLSDEELDMVGGYDNIKNIMLTNDISVVVLTMGSKGAELFFGNSSYVISGFKADVVADTTGAGDAFWGGFLAYLLNCEITSKSQLNLETLMLAVKYGNVSGVLAVQQKGAISSLPTKNEINKFLQEVLTNE